MVLNVTVLHRGGVVPTLYFDKTRFLNGGLIVTLANVGVLQDVMGKFFMELRRAVLHGLLHVKYKGQLLIFHLQRPDALHGGHLVFRDDHCHIVAPIAHMTVQQMPVSHVLMARVHRPWMSRRRERDIRHIKAGQHLYHAVDLLRSAGVDGLDDAVGNVRMLDADIQRILRHQVLIVFCPPGRLVIGVHTNLAFSDFTHVFFLLNVCLAAIRDLKETLLDPCSL